MADKGSNYEHACRNPEHRQHWRVTVRKANYSTFNGGRRTPSQYSEVVCLADGHIWRTKGKYVDSLPSVQRGERGE
jgi:hypothetical protein